MNSLSQLPERWQTHWRDIGYGSMTEIQKISFSPLVEGKGVLGISPTGTGKTVAYLLPLLLRVKKKEGMQLLVLLPSQELAVQIATICREWASLLEIQSTSIIGGGNVKRQIENLKKKPEVLIGTPGRVYDLIKQKKIKAHQLCMIVLDEIDSLISANQTTMVDSILKAIPMSAQMIGYSATGGKIVSQFQELCKKKSTPIIVEVENTRENKVLSAYIDVPRRKRVDMLRRLSYVKGFKALVFFNQVSDMGAASDKLMFEHVHHSSLASDQHKSERQQALESFRQGKVSLLLTTDIASRGLDIDDLYYVVEYECPLTEESYIHRSGRVGRMGRDGMVITLCTASELPYLTKSTNLTEITERFVFGGEIIDEITEKKDTDTQNKNCLNDNRDKNTKIKKLEIGSEMENENTSKKKKIKNRHRNKKNKGGKRRYN